MKKKIVVSFLVGAMMFSLAACGDQKPDLKDVEQAISNGEVTIEDVLDKGWVTQDWLDTLNNSYPEIQEKGAEILVCVKNYTEDQRFENVPFPIIIYNESVKNALDHMNMSEMAEEIPNCGNWFVNSYFASSWNAMITKEQLLKEVDIFTNLNSEGAATVIG